MPARAQAGQAVEPSALIPLQLLAPRGRLVLVGDPQQLPATVLSRAAERAGLGLSLFERLQKARSLAWSCSGLGGNPMPPAPTLQCWSCALPRILCSKG